MCGSGVWYGPGKEGGIFQLCGRFGPRTCQTDIILILEEGHPISYEIISIQMRNWGSVEYEIP